MISASTAFIKAVKEKNREFHVRDTYTFADGSVVEMVTKDYLAYAIDEDMTNAGKLILGATVIKKYTATLDNTGRRYDLYNFSGCRIVSRVGIRTEDGSIEEILKGVFWITKVVFVGIAIKIEAADAMMFFDKPYTTGILDPTPYEAEVIKEICQKCGVRLASTVFLPSENSLPEGYRLASPLRILSNPTFRDVLSYCAQLRYQYAKIDNMGYLDLRRINLQNIQSRKIESLINSIGPIIWTTVSGYADGGWFDQHSGIIYISGDNWDGGEFDDGRLYSTESAPDGSIDGNSGGYEHIYEIGNLETDTVDARIAGVEMVLYPTDENSDGDMAWKYVDKMEGCENYIFKIKKNPYIRRPIQSTYWGLMEDDFHDYAHLYKDRIIGNLRPLKVSCKSDPRIEVGDLIIVTDREHRSFRSMVTRVKFSMGNMQIIECSVGTKSDDQYLKEE